MAGVHEHRVRELAGRPPREDGAFVLYWMNAFRRTRYNHALEWAIERARAADRPLLVLEGLRAAYPHASLRHHRFVIEGMADQARAFRAAGIAYHPYVEAEVDAGQGLLEALMESAHSVVTDDWPGFFLPRAVQAAAARASIRFEAIDSCGLVPVRRLDRTFQTAASFRRAFHGIAEDCLLHLPLEDPLAGHGTPPLDDAVWAKVRGRWPGASRELLSAEEDALTDLPVPQAIRPVAERGGEMAARRHLEDWLAADAVRYAKDRSHPGRDASSRLSFWLHFGHLAPFEICARILEEADYDPGLADPKARGKRSGFFGLPDWAESYLDELVTWREIGLNRAVREPETWMAYEGLPDWARATLDAHRDDPREPVYSRDRFEAAETHDPLWNAAQRQLLREGRIHNYLRMLWGKKILHWSAAPEEALETMFHLNDRYAVDGRDPNSVSGITWVLGRYDRPWGPERPIFGKIRYMTSDNTLKKLRMGDYLERFGPN